MEGDKAKRTAPYSLTAQDFVDEWLSTPWLEIAESTDPAFRERHEALVKPERRVELQNRPAGRPAPASQWQIGVDLEDNKSGEVHKYYFLVAGAPGSSAFGLYP